ncbi:MAG: hypothetical protein IKK58_00155 [Clostridia bacterium]|nr:hypothetical protein [Clostridia bacterium]
MYSINQIEELATKFREAIVKAKSAGEFDDVVFKNFPSGCCGDTSDLLARYLLNNGIKTKYASGAYHNISHAWLITNNGIIVDITGDQFHDELEFMNYSHCVYVGILDKFHNLFINDDDYAEKEPADFEKPREYYEGRLLKLYYQICKYV